MTVAPPGWYPNPAGGPGYQWWSGSAWSTVSDAKPRRRTWLVVGAVTASVALWIFGLLAYTGFFDDPSLGRVVKVNGDEVCFSTMEHPDRVRCGTKTYADMTVEPGDCVLVYFRHGIEINEVTGCPGR